MTNDHAPNDTQFSKVAAFTLASDLSVPDAVLDWAATLSVDTLAVAAGARDLDSGRIARDFAADFMAAGTAAHAARLLFDGRSASLPGAAFAGATQIDNLDAHDGLNVTKGHIGCAVVPAILAFAEQSPGLGARDALVAMVVAYEVAARAAQGLHVSVSDYHTSGAWNGLGVVAAGARLRGLDPAQLRHAFGIAEYHGPRSQMMREIDNPTMLHDGSGPGALIGCKAVLMAERGFTGAPAITVEAATLAPFWEDLGAVWTLPDNYIKPYPICRWAHAAIDAVRALKRAQGLGPEDIAAVKVRTFAEAARIFPGVPGTTSQAQYSLAFAVAIMVVHGRIGAEHISGDGLSDAAVARVLPRISIVEDARHSARFPVGRWSDVTLTLADGRVLESGDVHARGGPEAPMTEAEIRDKVLHLAGGLGEERAQDLWELRDAMRDPAVVFADVAHALYVGNGTLP